MARRSVTTFTAHNNDSIVRYSGKQLTSKVMIITQAKNINCNNTTALAHYWISTRTMDQRFLHYKYSEITASPNLNMKFKIVSLPSCSATMLVGNYQYLLRLRLTRGPLHSHSSSRPQWSRVRSRPGSMDFFQSVKILSMTSFGSEVKPGPRVVDLRHNKRTSSRIQSL